MAWRSLLIAISIIGVLTSLSIWKSSQPDPSELAAEAKRSMRISRFEAALSSSEEAIRLGDNSKELRLIAGEAALKLKQYEKAIEHFDQIDDSSDRLSLAARISSASILLNLHDPGRTETEVRRALAIDPQDNRANQLMGDALGLQGRRWESIPYLRHGIQQKEIDLQTLCYLADTDRTVELSETQLGSFLESDNPKNWLGAACLAISYRKFQKAESLIHKCLEALPNLVEAHARLGKQLLSRNSSAVMSEWESKLPAEANDFPDIWFVRSQWCVQEKQYRLAAKCLLETLRRYPDHSAGNHQMGQVLSVLGQAENAVPFRERGNKLTRLAALANDVYLGDSRSAPLRESAELAESLGRLHEAIGWAVAAQHENPNEPWPISAQTRLKKKLTAQPATSPPKFLMALESGLLDLAWIPPTSGRKEAEANPTHMAATFRDVTLEAGITFQYENGEDPTTEGKLMFEYTGGGVGAFDYDRDSWPDLIFTQAGGTPPKQEQTTAHDALYRNVRGQRFAESSRTAGIEDYKFGQGVTAGDINNDGFPDLYIANIDGNQLYINQGDGTFQNETATSGIGHSEWTTSVAIVDLNLDSIPDIYDVTFLSDDDIFDRVCEEDGVKRSCAPAGFKAADDYIFQGVGNSSFQDVSATSGIRAPNGDGLGIVVADFAGTGRPSVFIANDGRANFYFAAEKADSEISFTEQALNSGLAFNRDGRAQACMGVASADFDGDGSWDLFVTNFFNESNTFYSQLAPEIFGDNSQQAGIREPSLAMLGFGVQAIDGELDGWEDLIVANGHVDDFSYKGIPYQMPMEYFRNSGEASFQKIESSLAGEVFAEPMLGRSMAIIDWNSDGLQEVAISRLGSPAMLLETTTAKRGNFLVVEVVGTTVARDATTARLTATIDERELVRQFTAGDGYQSSNQKQVVFGLGEANVVQELTIAWPGGATQSLDTVKANQTVVLREGDSKAWVVPTGR